MSNNIAKGVRVIRPYKKEPANMRTLEGSLYQNGYTFIPGTVRKFYPRVDSRGVIRTGLDENSPKFRGILNLEAREQEIQRVTQLREYYESLLDESLAPTSTFYDEIKENGYTLEDGDNIFFPENEDYAIYGKLIEMSDCITGFDLLEMDVKKTVMWLEDYDKLSSAFREVTGEELQNWTEHEEAKLYLFSILS